MNYLHWRDDIHLDGFEEMLHFAGKQCLWWNLVVVDCCDNQ